MKWSEVFSHTFKALREQIDSEAIKHQLSFMLPSMPMVEACRADDFDFFLPWMDLGKLTVDQMHHAAARYFLGKSKSGSPMFWMIDDMHIPLDAHITPDTCISSLLKNREPLLRFWRPQRCLFGLHLLAHTDTTEDDGEYQAPTDIKCPAETAEMAEIKFSKSQILDKIDSCASNSFRDFRDFCVTNKPVCVVESEQSAVILSELYPNSLWLAMPPDTYFSIDLLEPLKGRAIKVYPHTDATLSNYLAWLDMADMARQAYHLDITVSRTLEASASPSQKDREIDILQYLFELYSKDHP